MPMTPATSHFLREVATELTTPRLLLRCPRPGDGKAVHEAVAESLPDLRRWPASLPWVLAEPSPGASETFCLETHAAFVQRKRLGYLVFDRDTGNVVGCIGMQGIDWQVPKFAFGFWCRSSRLRQGHMQEALSALMRYARVALHARRLSCRTEDSNIACRRLCTVVGMELEGVLRHDRVAPDGTPRNMCVYAQIPAF
jgi:RimJ/RimL family protein N-acetyltransferase